MPNLKMTTVLHSKEKLEDIKLKQAMLDLAHLKGKAKKKVSPEHYEAMRTKAFEQLEKAR